MDYDALGREVFTSLESSVPGETKGTVKTYDGLSRLIQTTENFGQLVTTTNEYLSGNRTRITDPSGHSTIISRTGFASPNDAQVVSIEQPEGITTEMTYNIYGNLLTAHQYGGGDSSTQRWSYNDRLQVCRHYAPETGSKVFEYDNANLITAYAEGLEGTDGCFSGDLPPENRVTMSYDELGRNTDISYPDSTPDILIEYDENGNVVTNERGNTRWEEIASK